MRSDAIVVDPASILSGGLKGTRKKGSGSSPFDALMAQLSQRKLTEPVAAPDSRPLDLSPPAASTRPSTPDHQQSPIRRLEASLKSTGQPLHNFRAAPADRDKLREVLVKSGYSDKDAREIIERASEKDGSVNLGTMFGLLDQYQADQGPVLLLKPEDRPLLVQVFKDLGLGEEAIQRYLDSRPVQDGCLVISGLKDLFAGLQGQDQAGTVDSSVLRDLLQRLGLKQKDIQVLLSKATDPQGRTNPQAMLELLQAAAAKQDQGLKSVLEELAQNLKLNQEADPQTVDVSRLRQQVAEFLSAGENPVQKEAAPKLQEVIHAALKAAGRGEQAPAPQAEAAPAGQDAGEQGAESGARQNQRQAAALAQAARSEAPAPTGGGRAGGGEAHPGSAGATPASLGKASGFQALAGRRFLPAHVVRQTAEQMAQMARGHKNHLRLQLKPAELGSLTIKLSYKEGAVKATLVAESVAAKQALDSGLDQLKQQLMQQGIKAERIEVLVNPDAQRQAWAGSGGRAGGRGAGSRQGGRSGSGTLTGGEASPEEIAAAGAAAGDSGRINLFA